MTDANRRTGALDRQTEIYLAGTQGATPDTPVSLETLEHKAQQKLSERAFAYIAGGAGEERTIAANREAFQRWRIVPRMLRDISERDTSAELFGQRLSAPLFLSPIGVLEMAHPDADVAVAKAAAAEGVPLVFSTQASAPMEACAAAMGQAPRWYQLYWSKSEELNRSLVTRAEKAGCSAIVVTVDTTILGWRIRDLDLGHLPFLELKGLAQYLTDPVFLSGLPAPPQENPQAAVARFFDLFSQPALGWQDLAGLRSVTKLPVLVKGLQHPDDARQAVDAGLSGIIVSNHGGRQVDGALGSFDALHDIVDAVQGKLPVLFDSGVRGGADMFKALALGAAAVGIGRPYAYGLALAGQQGVRDVIRNLRADLELTMALSGCRTIGEINRDCLLRLQP